MGRIIKIWLIVSGGFLLIGFAINILQSKAAGDVSMEAKTTTESKPDDRIFTSLFACADHPGNGTNERLVANLAGVYRTQGLDQLKNVMGGSDYRKYCFLDGSPFAAAALKDVNVVQSWTDGNGAGVYVVRAADNLSFAVVYP